MPDFTQYDDEHLARWWNEGDGALSWLMALEDELRRRGYTTRDAEGSRACVLVEVDLAADVADALTPRGL